MHMNIWAVMIYYNEEKYLLNNMIRVMPFVDRLILVDGAFQGYDKDCVERKSFWSYDWSNIVIQGAISDWHFHNTEDPKAIKWYTDIPEIIGYEAGDMWNHHRRKGWKNEIEKRTFSIQQVPDGDYFFIIDADEILMGNPEYFREEVKRYDSKYKREDCTILNVGLIHYPDNTGWFIFPRIYKKIPNMYYDATHSNIFVDDKPVSWTAPYNNSEVLRSICMIHESAFYPDDEKQKMKWDYISKRQKEEDVNVWKRERLLKDVDNGAMEELMKAKRKTGVRFKTEE